MLRYAPAGGAWRWWISARIQNGRVNEGDTIEVVYGDTRRGEPGVQTQKFLEKDAYFEVLVDIKGKGEYVEIPQSPFKFDIIAPLPASDFELPIEKVEEWIKTQRREDDETRIGT